MIAATSMGRCAAPARITAIQQPDASKASDRLTDAQLMRYEVETLCSHMLWLRAWWERHGDAIRAADRPAAAHVHDHFIDGAGFARTIARQAGFSLDEDRMRNYSWGRSVQTVHMIGRAA